MLDDVGSNLVSRLEIDARKWKMLLRSRAL